MYRYHEDRPKPSRTDYRRPFERAQYPAAHLAPNAASRGAPHRGGTTLMGVLTLSPHELMVAIVTMARIPSALTSSCIQMLADISSVAKWPTNESNTPRLKISS
jgi:hypothetical protein